MKNKLLWLEIILVMAPFVALATLWNKLPPRFPVHWNLVGQVDRWSSNRFELCVLPLVILGTIVFIHFVPRLDPRLRRTLQEGDRMHGAIQIICIALALLFNAILALQLLATFGYQIAIGQLIRVALLIGFAIMGNYLGNLRPNYFIGIRTPWTLENPRTWKATHRVGGRLMFFGSLVLLALGFFLTEQAAMILLTAFILLLVVWAFLYSWHHFRTQIEIGKAG
jgi:uncharacterized membrane protein